MDGRPLGDHMVSLVAKIAEAEVAVSGPLNPIVYLLPPTLWLSGHLGLVFYHII